MFCYQCEQTFQGTGCVSISACGKNPDTAALQDLLIHAAKGISLYASRPEMSGARNPEIDRFIIEALFSTGTNVNFDPKRIQALLARSAVMLDEARSLYRSVEHEPDPAFDALASLADWHFSADLESLVREGERFSVSSRRERLGDEIAGLQELIAYGLKGAAAYLHHAAMLDRIDASLSAGIHECLAFLLREDATANELLGMALKVGELNYKIMELLDSAHVERFGSPVPTPVRISPVKGKAILVSGHDLRDLEALLEQTAGTGINVCTHGEMLPAHGYPRLKAHPHLVGNYGTAWQNQALEFDAFPGAILMTTNCIQRPRVGYFDRIFTSGMVAWPGVTHIADRDFGPVIEAALAADGFAEDGDARTVTVGFGHDAVLGVADQVIAAVKSGQIRHFFLIGGCDGAKPGRNYYARLAEAVPDDCMILTLACGKYRFYDREFGTVAGLPRLLDVGQCNDAYSAIKIAVALADAFERGVNDLPLSLVLSWYEQKAVAILLTLLHLGIKNIRLGPTLPAFVPPSAVKLLVETFGLAPIGTPEEDLKAMLQAA